MDLGVVEITTAVSGLLTGGAVVTFITLPQIIKKAKAEARAAEMDNVLKSSEAWEKLANELQEELHETREELKEEKTQNDDKIDQLYKVIGEWRDKYNHSQEELSQERIWRASNEVKLCILRNCERRDPPSGY